jgi:hypothetical protein
VVTIDLKDTINVAWNLKFMLKFLRKINRAMLYLAIWSHGRLCAFLFCSLFSCRSGFIWLFLGGTHLVRVRAPMVCFGGVLYWGCTSPGMPSFVARHCEHFVLTVGRYLIQAPLIATVRLIVITVLTLISLQYWC